MELRILGPIEVIVEGKAVPISGDRQRALLAYLLLHANEPVSGERLLDQVWHAPPERGVAALHSQITRLRRLLPDRIVTSGHRYTFRVESGELDLDRFRSLLAEAAAADDPAERSRLLRSAEELWRSDPLAELDAPFVATEAAALEELRVGAIEERVDADLERGLDGELAPELSALVGGYPFQERLHEALILALYRDGRQKDALAACRQATRVLDEIGLAPRPSLRDLERRILQHDPTLELAASPAAAAAATAVSGRPGRRLVYAAASLAAIGLAGGAVALLATANGQRHALARQPATPRRTGTTSVPADTPPAGSQTTTQSRPDRHQPAHRRRLQPAANAITARHHATPTATTAAAHTVAAPQQPAAPPAPAHTSPAHTTATTRAAKTTRTKTTPARTTPAKTTPSGPPAATTTEQTTPSTPAAAAAKAVTITDNFDDPRIDGTLWYQIHQGTGWTISARNGQLEFAFPPGTQPGGVYNVFGGHIGSQCKFPGDFDARVDFSLGQWPTGNNIQAALWAFLGPQNDGWQVWRWSSSQWGELYGSATGQGVSGGVPLDDPNGTLRLVRSDGLITAYFLHKGGWEKLTSGHDTETATIAVGAQGQRAQMIAANGKQVVIDFDNFSVTGDDPTCPAGSGPPNPS